MGYDFRPRNKDAGSFHLGAFSWPWMLEAGVGLPVGHGKGLEPATFVYAVRPGGSSLSYNDGERVTAKEAKQMAMVARWVADYQDHLRACWDRQSDADRERMSNDNHRLYNVPVRRDFVEKMREFADWAEVSGGFRVY